MTNDKVTRKHADQKRTREMLMCIDGARYLCGMCAISFERALTRLRGFDESGMEQAVPISSAMHVIADVWSVIDNAERLRRIVERTPGVKKNEITVQEFMRGTKNVGELRHYIQHIDREISELATPLWGAISWTSADNPLMSFTLMPATKHLRIQSHGMIYDMKGLIPISDLILTVGDKVVDIQKVVKLVASIDTAFRMFTENFQLPDGSRYDYEEGASIIGAEIQFGK